MIITKRAFSELVEKYVFKNETRYARDIARHHHDIPLAFRTARTAYRGMILDKDLVEAIKGGYNGFVLKDPSSWTVAQNLAEAFVRDKKYMVAKKGPNSVGVIFRRRFNEQEIILDIQGFALLFGREELGFDELTYQMALREQEILVKAGVKLKARDIAKVIAL